MKRFFKTSAIIACCALMFAACDRVVEDEDTDYGATEIVPASSINELYPGNGKFFVEWEVCDNSYVTSTLLTWDNGDGDSGEYLVEDVKAKDVAEMTIDGLPAGDYTVTLTNACDIDVYTIPVSRTVTVFDDDTYADSPALTYSLVVHDGTNATIYWDNEDQEDCVGIVATYTRDGSTFTSSLLDVSDGYTTLSRAASSQTISYITCYQPEIAIDGDYVEKLTESVAVPSPSPTSPTDVVVNPGNQKMRVTWSVDKSNEYYTKTVIVYGYTGGVQTTVSYDADDLENGENVKEFENLIAGQMYTVTIYNSGTASDAVSASVVVEDVEIYDLESLETAYSSSMPTLSLEMINLYLYVTVTQSTSVGAVECNIVTLNYQQITKDQTDTTQRAYLPISDFSEPTVITNAVQGSKYTYSATFSLPDGALDDDTVIEKHGTYEETYTSWYTLPDNVTVEVDE